MNTIVEQIRPCIRYETGCLHSQKVYTVEGDAIGAAWDAIKKLEYLAKWKALKPEDALKTLEEALEELKTS